MVLRSIFLHILLLIWCTSLAVAQLRTDSKASKVEAHDAYTVQASVVGDRQECTDGFAGGYPCFDIDLLAFLDIQEVVDGLSIFVTATNDIWGWTDPETGVEYALLGMTSGTAFIDLSDPETPKTVAFLTSETGSSVWRDIKVYKDHAFVVADAAANHGMQVFDLTRLRTITEPPMILQEDVLYTTIASAHNVAINEESGYAYIVGGNAGGQTCGGGLHMVNIQTPTEPVFEGCFLDSVNSYSHDVQCVNYRGPDMDYQGREICFGSNEVILSIADVTDKSNPVKLSSIGYPNSAYAHQGWLSEDHRYFYMDDESDEGAGLVSNTRTLIWDVQDLDDPVLAKEYFSSSTAADHNQYVRGHYLYQSNYESGLRILDISTPLDPVEVAFFDVLPDSEGPGFNGSWSNYPFFESGLIVATSIDEGFFVLWPSTYPTSNETPRQVSLVEPSVYPNPVVSQGRLMLTPGTTEHVKVDVYDLLGRKIRSLFSGTVYAGSKHEVVFETGGASSRPVSRPCDRGNGLRSRFDKRTLGVKKTSLADAASPYATLLNASPSWILSSPKCRVIISRTG